MKVMLMSIGTRGDMEPFLALGEILLRQGHQITYVFPAQFEKLAKKEAGFYALTPKFIELLDTKEGQYIMGGTHNFFKKIWAFSRLFGKSLSINRTLVRQQFEYVSKVNPDLIVYHAKCNYPVLWRMTTHRKTVLVSPIPNFLHPTEGHPHIGFPVIFGNRFSRMTYKLANFALSKTIEKAQNQLPVHPRFNRKRILAALKSEKLLFSISPSLYSPSPTWPTHVQVLGYNERNQALDWQPPASLLEFLDRHDKVYFLTFGSMINPNPQATSELMFRVFQELQLPVIVNTASGGLQALPSYQTSPDFYFIEQIPYDWVLKRVHGIVHHGGSGTTHSGLKYGCATLIIPHIIDQFGWNTIVSTLGAGPNGVGLSQLTAKKFHELLLDLATHEAYKTNARRISERMSQESNEQAVLDFILG